LKNFTANRTSHVFTIFSLFVCVSKVLVRSGLIIFFIFSVLSCNRFAANSEKTPGLITWTGAWPMAVLETGEYPLWFQLTEDGPVNIESIDDAVFSMPLVPWPYALHIRFMEKTGGNLVLVINRDGFLKLGLNTGKVSGADKSGIAMYRFSGGDFFRQYTAGGFVFYENNPAVILYQDNRFTDADAHLPQPRTWTFNMNSNAVFPLNIPLFQLFPSEQNWDIDSLRLADDGFYYYRAVKKDANPSVFMYRTDNLANTSRGTQISIDVFYNSAPRRTEINHPLLPVLPEDFFYTGIETIGSSLFASWEEQADYSIGAAGFLVIKQ